MGRKFRSTRHCKLDELIPGLTVSDVQFGKVLARWVGVWIESSTGREQMRPKGSLRMSFVRRAEARTVRMRGCGEWPASGAPGGGRFLSNYLVDP